MKLSLFFLLALFLSLLLPSALASSGCFMYAESSLFCQQVTDGQARDECALFNRCVSEKVFAPGKSCLSQPACQTILCKTSCREELAGRCMEGAVTDADWCAPGCCQFSYADTSSCTFTASKNRCLIAVDNRNVKEYRFSANLSEQSCAERCRTGKQLSAQKEIVGQNKTAVSLSPADQLPSFFSLLWVFSLVAVLLVFLFYFLWKRAHQRPQFTEEKKTEISEVKQKKFPWFFPFASARAKERLAQIKQLRQRKMKRQQREEFLAESGLTPEKEKPKEDLFGKLQKVAKKAKEEKSPLEMLDKMEKEGKVGK